MRQIRFGVFETNSSSTHSMVMCTKSEYKDWEDNKVYYCDGVYGAESAAGFRNGNFYPKELVDTYVLNKYPNEKEGLPPLMELGFMSFEAFYSQELYDGDRFYQEFTTDSGETVVAAGIYGHD